MELNLILLRDKKYFQYRFNKNNLTDIDALNALLTIMHYVKDNDAQNDTKSYILQNDEVKQFVGNAHEVNTYKDLFINRAENHRL